MITWKKLMNFQKNYITILLIKNNIFMKSLLKDKYFSLSMNKIQPLYFDVSNKMWQKALLLPRLIASSVCIAQNAGNLIKSIMVAGELGVIDKSIDGSSDLQTKADRSAQYLIKKSLHHQFGGNLKVIGEEEDDAMEETNIITQYDSGVLSLVKECCPVYYKDINIDDITIWVDPLDGTAEYAAHFKDKTRSLDQVTVLIGIAHKGVAIGGIVHQPYYETENGRTIWGVVGIGSFNYTREFAKKTKNTYAVTTRSHSTKLVDVTLNALKEKKLIDNVKRYGGAGYKVIATLEGATAYVFASSGCKKWDTCAPEAVLRAAGGDLTDIMGNRYKYHPNVDFQNHGGVLATCPDCCHEEFVNAIPESVRIALSKP
uniref:3'(2'),5'-bisphosphate nucleotidase 1 n=1 Tax=Strongyloides stercoralis TaxID=6248 RepID=A0A0K0DV66_STRER